MKYLVIAHAMNVNTHCCSSKGNFEISVGHLASTDFYHFKLKIKRRALYYGVMIIAPTVLFALMNPLVFLLPIESGERVSLAMTILLSYAIFLTLMSL
jgi:hypothetical protein